MSLMLVVATSSISILGPAREFPWDDLRYLSELFLWAESQTQRNPAAHQTRGAPLSITQLGIPMDFGSKLAFLGLVFVEVLLWATKLPENFPVVSCETFRIFFNGGLKFLQPHGDGKFEHINHFIKEHWESFILAVNFSCLQISFSG